MSPAEENSRSLPSYPLGSLESPFLDEELYVREAEAEWVALAAESPFSRALEKSWALTEATDMERSEALEEEIIGKDDRSLVTDTLKIPNRWICAIDILIDNPKWGKSTSEPQFISRSRATGILIGPRYVLTAKHILDKQPLEVHGETKFVDVKGLMVSAARNGSNSNNPFSKVKAKAWRVSQRYRVRRKARGGQIPSRFGSYMRMTTH